MKAKKTYLKGKSIFIVSLLVIFTTTITVYVSGINYNRSFNTNLNISLSIIGVSLLIFMTFGLYKGVRLIDNFPKLKKFNPGDISAPDFGDFDFPDLGIDDFAGVLLSIFLWLMMSVFFVLLLFLFESVFLVFFLYLITLLYWLFFRALRLVFRKSKETKGNLSLSFFYSLGYTLMYLGWIFALSFLKTTIA